MMMDEYMHTLIKLGLIVGVLLLVGFLIIPQIYSRSQTEDNLLPALGNFSSRRVAITGLRQITRNKNQDY